MKFALVGAQFRHFRNGLQCLGKIGAELLLEALPERLVLRAINSSRSAFASVTYHADFFAEYDMDGAAVVQAGVLMKLMAAIFRTQRPVQTAFEVQADGMHLKATVTCENGLQKVYTVPCTDSDILQATVDTADLSICMVGRTDEFNRLLSSFQSTLSEVTIIALPEGAGGSTGAAAAKDVRLRSYMDPAKGFTEKALYTALDIDAHTLFTWYENRACQLSDVTFNLKDFKTMLALCEAMHADIAIRFNTPGAPLVVGPHLAGAEGSELRYEAELILATLLESQAANDEAELTARSGRTPSVTGDTPWRSIDGRTPDTGGRAANGHARPTTDSPADRRPSGGGSGAGSGAGRSRFGQETARRDLGNAMQHANDAAAPAEARRRSTAAAAPAPRAGNGAAPENSVSFAAGLAARHGNGRQHQQQQQQRQQQQSLSPQPGGSPSFAGFGGGAAAAEGGLDRFESLAPEELMDDGLDDFASLAPDDGLDAAVRRDGGGRSHSVQQQQPSSSRSRSFSLNRREEQYAYDDAEGAMEDDAVPGTPPGS